MRTWITPSRWPAALLVATLAGLAGGLGARLAGADELADRVLVLTVVAGLLPPAVSVAGRVGPGARRGAARHRLRRPLGEAGPTVPGQKGHPSLGRPPAAP
jgi:hypothetical protein